MVQCVKNEYILPLLFNSNPINSYTFYLLYTEINFKNNITFSHFCVNEYEH